MILRCPCCGSPESVRVLQTVRRANGARWRRHECRECLHRFSTTETGAFEPTFRRSGNRSVYEIRNLSDREAALVILSDEPLSALVKRYGLTKASIQAIRRGRSYRNVHQLLQPLLEQNQPC